MRHDLAAAESRRVAPHPGHRLSPGNTTAAAVLALCLSALPPASAGDSEPAVLEPMVTVATRSERPLTEVAGNVTVLSRDELDLTLTRSLGQAFRYTPGIDAPTGTRFGTEGIIVRGIAGNRVAMELDGVPLSSQFSVGSFAHAIRDLTDVGMLERIEVLHGPGSALYGSAALGGVVSFASPDPMAMAARNGGPGYFLSQGLQSADDSLHTVGAAAAAGDGFGILGMAGLRSGHEREAKAADTRDPRDFDHRSGLVKAAVALPGGHALRGLYYGHESEVQTSIRSVLGSGRFVSTTRLEGDDRYRADLLAAELTLAPSGRVSGGAIRVWWDDTDIRQRTVDERRLAARPVRIDRRFDYHQDNRGVSVDLRRRLTAGAWTHHFAAGAEWNRQRLEESRDAAELGLEDGALGHSVLGESFPVRDFPVTDANEFGLYLHDEIDLGRTRVIAGLRFDRNELDPQRDRIYEEDNPATAAVGLSEDELSPKLGVVVGVAPGLNAWLQYAHGFRAPSFEEANVGLDIPLFNVRAIPNPDLRPETSDGVEAGLRWRGGRTRLDANVFYTRYDDFIETKVRLGVDPLSGRLLFQSRNVADARIYGAGLAAEMALDDWLRGLGLKASAYWARGDNRESDEPLNDVGPAQAVLAATWATPDGRSDLSLFGTFTARHRRLDTSRGPLFEAPGHAVFDLYVSRRLGRHLLLRGGIENLLDRTYWHWADVRGLAPEDPTVPLLSQPGRGVALDARWTF